MTPAAPEIIKVDTRRVSCDGASSIRSGKGYRPAALGHPRVFMQIDEQGFADCGYCDRRFVLRGGPADAEGSQPQAHAPAKNSKAAPSAA